MKYLKLIGIFALFTLLWGVEVANSSLDYAKANSGELLDVIAYRHSFNTPDRTGRPKAELGGINLHHVSLLSYTSVVNDDQSHFLLKWIKKQYLDYNNTLAKHHLKHYNSYTHLVTGPPCEYYVFTLRKLLI
ncbi:hypothetical protein D0T60_01175 [Bacteroides sp. 224]|nr:hypothetical protein [Bacteroides sp. 224]